MISPEEKKSIVYALRDCRNAALADFVADFIVILDAEGFTVEDLLGALATWANNEPQFEGIIKYLEDASNEACRVLNSDRVLKDE